MKNSALGSFWSAIAAIMSSRKFSIVFIAILSIILFIYCLKVNPIREGDGYEYAVILQSFFNHFSPDIRESDITSLIKIVETQPSSYDVKVLQGMLTALKNGENEIYLGILKSSRGEYFGYHFWIYPLINLPAKAFLAALRMNELKAFQLTNAILISLTLVYVLLFSKQSPFARFTLTLLYLSGCIFFYLLWPHPEVCIAASILISGCAFLDQRIYLAAIAACLATLQNPSVVFLLASILIFFVVKNFKSHILPNPRDFLKKYIWLGFIAVISLFPYVFYYYHYQIPNLIVARGFVNPNLISWERFLSTLFDLNQGLVVGFPGVLFGIVILLAYRIISVILKQKRPIVNQSDILLVAFLLMLQPTLSQTNWNHGQEIFSRYAFWGGMALIIWVSANIAEVKGLLKYWLLPIILGLQIFPNELFFKRPWDGHYLKMKYPAAKVLSYFPNWYNPEPEIFAERTRGYERFGEVIAPNQSESPFIYVDQNGDIRKILVYRDYLQQTEALLCGINGKLISTNSQYTIEKLLANIVFNRQGWGYLNGNFRCAVPLIINFSENGNSPNFTDKGWGKVELDGSLLKSPVARLLLPIDNRNLKNVKLIAQIANLSEKEHSPIALQVIVNNRSVSKWNFNSANQTVEYETIIPAEVLRSQSSISISFQLLGVPKRLSNSTKVKFVSIKIDAI